jgi:hypothetical protein
MKDYRILPAFQVDGLSVSASLKAAKLNPIHSLWSRG